ncbi:MAG TPA: hypothetical protein DCG78_05860 [Anaerolineaceae bacterium]|nr:hypothetical protein [Anaerolineaceae bacterium]
MPNASERFRTSLRLAWRQITHHWSYPLAHLIVLAVFFIALRTAEDISAKAILETIPGDIGIALASLAGILIAGASASRSPGAKFSELEQSFPGGSEVILGRSLASFLASILFLIEPLLFAALNGPWDSFLSGLPIYLAEGCLTVALPVALVWLLAHRSGLPTWSYPLLGMVWLGFFGLGYLTPFYSNPAFGLLNFMRHGSSYYSEMWGRLLLDETPRWADLFYVGLGVAALVLLWLVQTANRLHRVPAAAPLLLAASLVLSGFSAVQYSGITSDWLTNHTPWVQTIDPATHVPRQHVAEPYPFGEPPAVEVDVRNYDLTLDFSNEAPKFHATLELGNDQDRALQEFVLLLNGRLALTESSLPCEKQGIWLRCSAPEAFAPDGTLRLELSYEGTIHEAGMIPSRDWQLKDFILPNGLRLSPQAAWYPIPYSPSLEDQGVRNDIFLLRKPALVTLEVIQSASHPYRLASNLPHVDANRFESQGATWIFLIGSPNLVEEQMGDIRLVTARNDLEAVRGAAERYRDIYETYRTIFPAVNTHTALVMALGEELGLPEETHTPPTLEQPVIISSRYVLWSMGAWDQSLSSKYYLGDAVLAEFWLLNRATQLGDEAWSYPSMLWQVNNSPVWYATSSFLWEYYESGGDALDLAERINVRIADQAGGPGESPFSQIVNGLLQVYQQGGQAGLVHAINQLSLMSEETYNTLYAENPEALRQWIVEAGDEAL